MLYIANIKLTIRKVDEKKTTVKQMAQLVDAIDENEAEVKINDHYNSLSTDNIIYNVIVKDINGTIS